jgi:hypothetical protein
VRDDRARGNFHGACRYHRRAVVYERLAERISLSPSGIEPLACFDAIPGCGRRMYAGQRHDWAVAQHAAEREYG